MKITDDQAEKLDQILHDPPRGRWRLLVEFLAGVPLAWLMFFSPIESDLKIAVGLFLGMLIGQAYGKRRAQGDVRRALGW